MNDLIFQRREQLKGFMKATINRFFKQKQSQLFNFLLIAIMLLLLQQKEVSLNFNISGSPQTDTHVESVQVAKGTFTSNQISTPIITAPAKVEAVVETAKAYIGNGLMTIGEKMTPASTVETATKDNLSNTYSNMTYHNEEQPTTTSSAINVSEHSKKAKHLLKRKKQDAYVARFAKVAQAEMRKFGIPASITLAQGLIESNAGDSRLSKKNNNHFGMKCFSSKCGKGHCSNFTDDSHKDFFRKYDTAWESFRAHSQLLRGKRYRRLFKLQQTDYKGWATGLKKAGYATDPKYAQKLIHIIEELNLQQYDQL